MRAFTDPSDRLTPHMPRHAAHSCCNEHGKSILRRAVNEIFQGRRNVSNIRGTESEKFLILNPLDCRKRPFQGYCKEKIFNQRKNI